MGMTMTTANATNAHDFTFQSIEGKELPLSTYKGKAVLIVNTASKCGFTKQYDDLQSLWEKYEDDGLVVLGVPSNDFGAQEPGIEEDIQNFCEVNFNVNFPMTEKEVVSGKNAHPFYQWAKKQKGFTTAPKWNFHKYLIDQDGNLVDWFATPTKPMSSKVQKAVEKLVGQ
jgi:glutathione peroxidase